MAKIANYARLGLGAKLKYVSGINFAFHMASRDFPFGKVGVCVCVCSFSHFFPIVSEGNHDMEP